MEQASVWANGHKWKWERPETHTLLSPLYLQDSQYHSAHVCHDLTQPACPPAPKDCTWPPQFAVHSLTDSHSLCSRCGEISKSLWCFTHGHRKDFPQPGLSTSQKLSDCLRLRPRASYNMPADINCSVHNPLTTTPLHTKNNNVCIAVEIVRGRREEWREASGCFEMQNSPH